MIELKIGGVPEHFNWPWLTLVESGKLRDDGIEIRWRDYPGGSGAMAAALDAGELDVAMLLTEGAVAGIAAGRRYAIASLFTETPLVWGIHVPAGSGLNSVADIRGRRYAISRVGSGSHLMCFVHARQMGWPVDDLELVTVGNLDGAIEAFSAGRADVFFWEKLMTKPLVDRGSFRRVGELVAPWPAFVVCASRAALSRRGTVIAATVERVVEQAATLAQRPDAAAEIARRYGLANDDVAAWLGVTRWTSAVGIDASIVGAVARTLEQVGLIAPRFDVGAAIATLPR
jgi:sulfonate transport system substrate-binding protein